MIALLERALRQLRPLFFLSLLVLAACGPGSGGTGTGPKMALKFSGSSVGGASGGGVDPAAQFTLDLRIDNGLVELVASDQLAFRGEWPELSATEAVVLVPGQAMLPGGPQPALLRLDFNGEPQASSAVTVTITSADGVQVLLNPLTLMRVADSSRPHP